MLAIEVKVSFFRIKLGTGLAVYYKHQRFIWGMEKLRGIVLRQNYILVQIMLVDGFPMPKPPSILAKIRTSIQ